MSSNGDLPESAYDSDDDALRAPADDAPLEERVLYVFETVKLGRAEQRRMRLQIKGVGDKVTALAEAQTADVDNIIGEVAELRGVMLRVESVVLTVCAKLENHFRESEPPSLERLQAMRAAADKTAAELRAADEKQAKRLERVEAERRVRGVKVDARLGEHDREIASLKADAKDTTRQAVVTAEHALEIVAAERDSAHELLTEERRRFEEKKAAKEAKAAEANANVTIAREGRRWDAIKFVAAPGLLIAAAILGAKLQACTGAPPLHIPAPATAPH